MNQVRTETRVHIRWMIRRDMEEVLEIEQRSFEFPWPEDEFIRVLRERNCIGMVADASGSDRILGFLIYELHKTRLHILNFAVADTHRRQGIGRQMIRKLADKLHVQRRKQLLMEVENMIRDLRAVGLDGWDAVEDPETAILEMRGGA